MLEVKVLAGLGHPWVDVLERGLAYLMAGAEASCGTMASSSIISARLINPSSTPKRSIPPMISVSISLHPIRPVCAPR